MRKSFFDSELWKWITCLFEIALLAAVIILIYVGIRSLAFVRG